MTTRWWDRVSGPRLPGRVWPGGPPRSTGTQVCSIRRWGWPGWTPSNSLGVQVRARLPGQWAERQARELRDVWATDTQDGLKTIIARAVGPAAVPGVAIEHVGSTSVPNTYLIMDGCLSLRNHLGVRHALRQRPDLRDRYGALKKQVGATALDL